MNVEIWAKIVEAFLIILTVTVPVGLIALESDKNLIVAFPIAMCLTISVWFHEGWPFLSIFGWICEVIESGFPWENIIDWIFFS
ncbi:MAG: hypothetical protein JRI43_03895 [Deltaproteobacteria bacterium]|nr:hypothetical protein [Deltaproteobacteria bacterium]